MKIRLSLDGVPNDEGARYRYSTVVRVESDEEAEIAGQMFARIVHGLGNGMTEYHRAIYGMSSEGTDDP